MEFFEKSQIANFTDLIDHLIEPTPLIIINPYTLFNTWSKQMLFLYQEFMVFLDTVENDNTKIILNNDFKNAIRSELYTRINLASIQFTLQCCVIGLLIYGMITFFTR